MPQLQFQPFQPPQTQLPQNTIGQQLAAQQQQQGQQQGIPGMQEALKAIQGMYQKMGQPAQGTAPAFNTSQGTTPQTPGSAVTSMGGPGGAYAPGPPSPILQQMARPGVNVAGVDAVLGDKLTALYNEAPPDIQANFRIGSGVRSNEEQARLYQNYLEGKGPLAAPPGKSRHQVGNALDLWYGERGTAERERVKQWVHANAPRFGLAFPLLNRGEDWHVEVKR